MEEALQTREAEQKENAPRFRLKKPKKKTVALLLAAVLVLCAGGMALRSMGGQ